MTGVLIEQTTLTGARISSCPSRLRPCRWLWAFACLLALGQGSLARAAELDTPPSEAGPARPIARDSVPVVVVTATAFGGAPGRYGAAAVAASTSALSGDTRVASRFGGGVRLWGAPWQRITIGAEAMRRDSGELAPSLALQVLLAGSGDDGWALGALGRYKAEGFAEVEGEVELGLLASFLAKGLHGDLNVVAGRGFEEEETDAEALLRAGYDVLPWLQLGVEGRYRARLAGEARLPGGKSWDAFGGPEAIASFDRFFAALLAGPTTVGVVDGVGLAGLMSVGGVM